MSDIKNPIKVEAPLIEKAERWYAMSFLWLLSFF